MTALTRFAPGATLPDHEHTEIEQSYVLQGSLVDDEGVATAGNYVWRPAGSRHDAHSPDGCHRAVVLPEAQQVLRHGRRPHQVRSAWRTTIRTTAITRRAFLRTAAAAGVTAIAAATRPGRPCRRSASDMAARRRRLAGHARSAPAREAQLEWTNRRRESWHYVPRSRPGVALRDMNAAQTAAAWDVLGSLLSARGLDQVRGQLTIERILGELIRQPELPRSRQLRAGAVRRSGRHGAPWAWRFEGHHLSLSVLVAPGHGVAVTPVFFGANPAHVPPRPCPRRLPPDRRGGGRGLLPDPLAGGRPCARRPSSPTARSATSSRGPAASST